MGEYKYNEDKIKFITEVLYLFSICTKNKYNNKLEPLDSRTNNPIHKSHLKVIDDKCFDDYAIIENIFTEEDLVYQELLQEKTENLDNLIEDTLDSNILSEYDKEEIVDDAFYTKMFYTILFPYFILKKEELQNFLENVKKIISNKTITYLKKINNINLKNIEKIHIILGYIIYCYQFSLYLSGKISSTQFRLYDQRFEIEMLKLKQKKK